MRASANLALALRRLRHHPWRSFLLLQGTIWGVAVALLQPAVMSGTRDAIVEQAARFGFDRMTVAVDPTAVESKGLSASDVGVVRAAIEAEGVFVDAASGVQVFRGAPAPRGVADAVDWLFGPPDAPTARGLEWAAGRAFEPKAASLEVVVEGLLAAELARAAGRGDDPKAALGTTLVAPDGRRGAVVGVLAAREPARRRTNDMGLDTGHPTYRAVTAKLMLALGVPLGDDAWKRTDRCAYAPPTSDELDWLFVRVAPGDLRAAARATERTLLAAGKSTVRFYPMVGPMMLARDFDRFRTVPLALFLACLTMGAVVMAHVGLLAAMRRAGEIAVHRAEGATRRDVVVQFLAEGGVLALVGGLAGCGVACGLAELRIRLEPTAGVVWTFPWNEAWVALCVSVVVGVLACVAPARRAAGIDPAEALSDE